MTELRRILKLPMLTFYGVGMILGAGIYSIIGKASFHTGETLWLGFVFASIAALLTAFTYAELSSMFPKAGAEFFYLQEAFNKQKWLGSTVGACMAFSGAATAATVAVAFAGYFQEFIQISPFIVASGILSLLTTVAIIGLKTSGWIMVVSTLIEISGLLFIIYLGINSEAFGKVLSERPHAGTLSGAALIIFSFFGFENIVNLAEETERPERNIPRAIFLSLVITTGLYIFVSLSTVAILPLANLSHSSAPLMAAAQTHSQQAARILGMIALFSTANTALISIISASRILYSMGEKKSLPSLISLILPWSRTPWIATLVIFLLALALLPLGKLEIIASISSFSTLLAFFSVNITVIFLRYVDGSRRRPFKVPLALGRLPLLPLLGGLICLVLMTQFERVTYFTSGLIILMIAFAFLFVEKIKPLREQLEK